MLEPGVLDLRAHIFVSTSCSHLISSCPHRAHISTSYLISSCSHRAHFSCSYLISSCSHRAHISRPYLMSSCPHRAHISRPYLISSCPHLVHISRTVEPHRARVRGTTRPDPLPRRSGTIQDDTPDPPPAAVRESHPKPVRVLSPSPLSEPSLRVLSPSPLSESSLRVLSPSSRRPRRRPGPTLQFRIVCASSSTTCPPPRPGAAPAPPATRPRAPQTAPWTASSRRERKRDREQS